VLNVTYKLKIHLKKMQMYLCKYVKKKKYIPVFCICVNEKNIWERVFQHLSLKTIMLHLLLVPLKSDLVILTKLMAQHTTCICSLQ